MIGRKPAPGAYDWLQIEGVDYPYPPAVQEALDLVEGTTRWLEREARQAECPHENIEHLLARNFAGEQCINQRQCVDCGMAPPPEPASTYRIPIMIDPFTGNSSHKPTPFDEYLVQQMGAVLDDARQLMPVKRGRLSESITSHPIEG